MNLSRIVMRLTLLIAVLAMSSAPLWAQEGSGNISTGTEQNATAFFNDNRINSNIILGEFGIFCTNGQGQTANTFQNGGGIAVWGANGNQYLFVPEAQISFLGTPGNAGMTMGQTGQFGTLNNTGTNQGQTGQQSGALNNTGTNQGQTGQQSGALNTTGTNQGSTGQQTGTLNNTGTNQGQTAQQNSGLTGQQQFNQMMTAGQFPILLGQAQAMNGPVQLFLTGENSFQLNGFFPDGKGFAYNWTGCAGSTGVQTFFSNNLNTTVQGSNNQSTGTQNAGTQNNQQGTGTGTGQ